MKYLHLLSPIVYTTHCASAQTTIVGYPSSGNSILYDEELAFTGRISIESNIPVTLQQYTYDASSSTEHPLYAGAAVVQVTSSCSTDVSDTLPIVTKSQGARGLELTVSVLDADPNAGFLESSSYQTSWTEFDCPPFTPDPTVEATRAPDQDGGFCLTQEDCDAARLELGLSTFSKRGNAYFSTGAGVTEADMSTTDLPFRQERIFCDGGDVPQPTTTLPTTTAETTRTACLTANECVERSEELGLASFQSGQFQTSGCFSKNDKAYFSIGSVDEMSTPDLPGIQERIWCGSSGGETSTTATTRPVADVSNFCFNAIECEETASELGFNRFQVGDFPTKGCFSKGDKAYFSLGGIDEMSSTDLPGVQDRIYCSSGASRSSSLSTLLNKVANEDISQANSASSASYLSLRSVFALGVALARPSSASHPRNLQTCTYNLEVLYNACEIDVISTAVTRSIVGYTENVNSVESGRTSADLVFPSDRATTLNGIIASIETTQIGQQCNPIACGRPFVDSSGNGLTASLLPSCSVKSHDAWSELKPVTSDGRPKATSASPAIKQEWVVNALGEHSSIASFAAFAIELMTNGAPSDLVEESLRAGLDEVRHAKVSFAIASHLNAREIVPGALPQSTHLFNKNLTSLVEAVAKEGCIDESLSAISAATEVKLINQILEGQESDKYSGVEIESLRWIRDELTIIAQDEYRHANLAFRTLEWACELDETLCTHVKSTILSEAQLAKAFLLRFQDLLADNREILSEEFTSWIEKAGLKNL
ncbi:hypothetical protein THAOC_33149 [Thalassiosira oceanica]|uniref:Ferritin-like domain-containing protein n=1 Tax=Thalassiosira oceanica TaxID=159749 RepID=K0R4M0_THAOC|nr:hypothetical protein THAOC_33149 [Thalassiosira oceanica]|eukprot:EJK48083.1 hypothetical protein THAOC_33149 [Thalassiosira oceanica]